MPRRRRSPTTSAIPRGATDPGPAADARPSECGLGRGGIRRSWERAVVALILVTTASLISTALLRREQGRTLAEQRKAELAYHHERQRAEEAEARFRLARRAVDELIRVSQEELAHRPGTEGLRKRLLASALAYYQEFIEQRRNDPGSQADAAGHHRRVETILADLAVLRAGGSALSARPANRT